MGKLIAVLLLVAVAGVPTYVSTLPTAVTFDVTSTHNPLGTVDIVDRWLWKHGFERVAGTISGVESPEGTLHYRYLDNRAVDSGRGPCFINIWVDGAGSIRTLAAEFASGSYEIDASHTVSQGLSVSLWERVTGAWPGTVGSIWNFDDGRVKASWVKRPTESGLEDSIIDRVLFEVK